MRNVMNPSVSVQCNETSLQSYMIVLERAVRNVRQASFALVQCNEASCKAIYDSVMERAVRNVSIVFESMYNVSWSAQCAICKMWFNASAT